MVEDEDTRSRDLGALSVEELMRLSRDAVTELRTRGVVRTGNAPAGDYAEWLVAKKLRGELETNSTKSHDVMVPMPGGEKRKLQVKCRVVTDPTKRSERQLSPFRSWDCEEVVIVLFDARFGVRTMTRLPTEVVEAAARWQEHVHGWIVFATDELLANDAAVQVVP